MNDAPSSPARSDAGMSGRAASAVAVSVGVFIAVFGFLPLANFIAGGRSVPWYATARGDWLNGSLIAIGFAAVYAIVSRRYPSIWRGGSLQKFIRDYELRPSRLIAAAASVAFVAYASVALFVFDGRPLLIDEIVQMLQARIFAEGRLARTVSAYPEFFSTLHVLDLNGRYFSQFPAGGPAMYLPAWILGASWLANPVYATVSVVAFARWVRLIETRASVALGATLVFAFAPFMVFMSGSHMNHVPTLMWTLLAMLALATLERSATERPLRALLLGLALGCAATIRPVDALAFALPAGLWVLLRATRMRRVRELVASGAGVAIPLTVLLWINSRTTGSPVLFGYELLWGASHGLGFHVAPWGFAHTPARGLELINLYFLRLQNYLFESPVPSLVPVIGALAIGTRWSAWDRYLLASGGLLILLYFAYWHDGFYLGPRFMFPLMPAFALLSARLPAFVRERWGSGGLYRGLWAAITASILIALAISVPLRARQYSNGLLTMRWDADAAARRAGVKNAVVLVRESWGAQLVARLWALGISRSDTERLYRRIDACQLDSAISVAEQSGTRRQAALSAIGVLLRDSARVQASPFSPDSTEGFRRDVTYTPRCVARINDDRRGFTLMAPLLLARQSDVLYIRDLHERDSLIISDYPQRNIFLLRPADASEGAPPAFYPLSRDSLYRAWRANSDR